MSPFRQFNLPPQLSSRLRPGFQPSEVPFTQKSNIRNLFDSQMSLMAHDQLKQQYSLIKRTSACPQPSQGSRIPPSPLSRLQRGRTVSIPFVLTKKVSRQGGLKDNWIGVEPENLLSRLSHSGGSFRVSITGSRQTARWRWVSPRR